MKATSRLSGTRKNKNCIMMKVTTLFLLLFILPGIVRAQKPDLDNTHIVNGFGKKISGDDFIYHSSLPMAKECLLIRATDGKSSMEWQTAAAPASSDKGSVTFIWLAGIGSSPGNARFDVKVNGRDMFTFWSDGADQWTKNAEDGSSLSFVNDMTDQNGDRFGFMYLRVPESNLVEGQPVTLKVTGGNFNTTSWYMTFRFSLENSLTIKSLPAIFQKDGSDHQLGIAGIFHPGKPQKAKIFVDNKLVSETTLSFGYNYLRVALPHVKKEKKVQYRLEAGSFTDKGTLTLKPVRRWNVNFVQHSHTDIGYTRSQTEILAEHLRYIDYALDYCDITDNYPVESRFRWTCEVSWAVDEYLRSRPEAQIERLKKRVSEGRIEIAGMYFNFDELPDEQTLAASLHPLKRIREKGLDVKVAMQNDVNGIGWCLNDYYSELGIRYLNMGTHGHRALICFDKPTLFWWESPSGNRMLAYRAEHYMIGNTVFYIHTGNFNRFEEELLSYLTQLEGKGYKYDLISIQHSGYLTDNAPPSVFASDMIKQWNEKYTWPKLKTATATEFFENMEARHGDEFQVIRGAWPDWWTDGFGASAREVAATRLAQSDLIANSAGLTMAAIQGSKLPEKIHDRIEAVNTALLFYTEHTVGFHASVREPFHKNTMEQRAIKESYAWEAGRRSKMLGEEVMGLLQSHVVREKEPALVVYNTLNWTRSGLFTVYIDHQILPRYSNFQIVDQHGKKAKAQAVEHHSDGTYWAVWVDDVPAFGFRKFNILVDKEKKDPSGTGTPPVDQLMENSWYKLNIDNQRGAITGIYDKELGKDLVDPESEWKMGEFIYETLDNRAQMESFRLDSYKRELPDSIWFDGAEEGDIWNTMRFKGNTRAANRDGLFSFEIRLFNTGKRIDLAYFIEKKMVFDPEGIYIAFPFILDDGQLAFDVPGGDMRAGIDQIPGSTNDWNVVQNYARLYNSGSQLLLSSREIPLMQFGGINTGRFKAGATPEKTHIFGWPMNNYWTTNFNPEQHGGITWEYSISSSADHSQQEASRFGWGYRVPFLARVLPGGGSGSGKSEGSFISGWPDNVVLVNAVPEADQKSAILQVRETDGKPASLVLRNEINGTVLKLDRVNVLGEIIEDSLSEVQPFGSAFFRLSY